MENIVLFENLLFEIKGKDLKNEDKYINWMSGDWLKRFINYNIPNRSKGITFISVNGRRPNLKDEKNIKIFFSGENLESNIRHKCTANDYLDLRYYWFNIRKNLYKNYLLKEVDFSLGFGKNNCENYLRFPLWIMYLFPPECNYEDLKNIVEEINDVKSKKAKECVCINSHDLFGTRSKVCNDLKNILKITYAGKWRNNSNELWTIFDNDKCKYMNLFKFNICPENMDAAGYCTEKIFDALRCGCIPIYAGCLNNPEPEIINHDFVIFWDLDGDNYDQIKLVDRLNNDDNYYQKFMMQPKLKADAADYIAEYFEQLKLKIKELI